MSDGSTAAEGRSVAPRRLLANLDCETEMAGAAAAARDSGRGGAPRRSDAGFALPGRVLRLISAAGTLMRALGEDDDVLWTPAPVAAARLPAVAGLPTPALESGSLRAISASSAILAWGETEDIAWLRGRDAVAAERAPRPGRGATLRERLWATGPPSVEAAVEVNHRGFALLAAEGAGCALPGAAMVLSLAQLRATLRDDATGALRRARVLKAPHSAAGRDRVLGRGDAPSADEEARAGALLDRHGALLLEPWLDRTADFGASAIVDATGLRVVGTHALEVDARGGFRGIVLRVGEARAPGMRPGEHERAVEALEVAARRAARQGYRGPMTVDSYRFRDTAGAERLHPLGEVNARLSFGLVARVVEERLLEAGAVAPGDTLALRVGRPAEGDPPEREPAARRLALLEPGEDDPTAAWLEARPCGRSR